MVRFMRIFLIGCTAIGCMVAGASSAAAWPERPITLVVPFSPSGSSDQIARIIGRDLSAELGQPIVVENRAGAGGMVGAQYVARAPADGYTLLLGSFANLLNDFVYKKPLINMRKDLAPVSQVVSVPNYVGANPRLGFNSFSDLLSAARARPHTLTCATSGVGTSGDIACAMLRQMANVDVISVPYKGGGPAMVDVMSGHADFLIINDVLPLIRDRRITGLAVTSPVRSSLVPDLPPVAETIPGFELVSWYGVFAPAGTPPDILEKVSVAIAKSLQSPDTVKKLTVLGATPVGSTPQAYVGFIKSEYERWGKVAKSMNITLD